MTLDADEGVQVAVRADTLAKRSRAVPPPRLRHPRDPRRTTRDLLKGNPARLPAYVDSAYFLVFSRALQGIAEVGRRRHRGPGVP